MSLLFRSAPGRTDAARSTEGSPPVTVATSTSTRKMVFGATLVFAMAVSAYTQFLLGVLGPLMIEDLGLTRTQFGALTTAIFVIGGVGAPLLGPLVDSLGGRRVLVTLFIAGGISWITMGLAPTFLVLLIGACFAGFVRGASNPVGNQLIATHAPPQHQGLIMGISKSGAQIGAFGAGVILPPVAVAFGWRGAALGSAILAVIGLLLTFLVIPPDGSREELRARSRGSSTSESRQLLWWLGGNAALVGFGVGSVNAYLPLFAVERLDMSVAAAGAVVSVMALTGIVGRIYWGRQTERFRSPQLALVVLCLLGAVSLLLLTLATAGGEALIWVGAIGFSLSTGSWIAVGMTTVIKQVPVTLAGRVSGVVLGCFYGGFAFSPITFGALVDLTDSYVPAWGMSVVSFSAAAAVALVSHRRIDRAPTPQPEGP